MSTSSEKRLLKEFLDGFETTKLFELVRSVYHGGGIRVNTQEDAEVLLLSQPYTQVLSSKKVPITNLLKFLISKGLVPLPNPSKSDLILAFKTLIENQPDYVKPIQPPQPKMQPFQSMQMPVAINMMESPQNNNMTQHYYPPVQPIQPSFSNQQISVQKSKKDILHEQLEEFIEVFAKNFYELFNNLGVPGKNQLDCRYFYDSCTLKVKILGGNEEINENCEDSSSLLQCLLSVKNAHQLFFSPNLSDGVKWKKEMHGLIKVHIGGTLHQGIGRLVGMFEQQFVLREDPQAENTWKICNTNLMMKSMDSLRNGSTLSIQESQTNNLEINCIDYK
ncbi:Uncharacterised protein C3orf38 (DUF4518) [Cinara cedri]|uniref:NTF2-like domain n=1 Tax=Cinara cedri TaxID=506608 RepID=A0A5E4MGR6_9HEMI|nr:Uncharacterised protein C3orf38 (DUF4518) [Cinara cedri]